MKRGEVWWADLESPSGSEVGGSHPVLIVQADTFNASRIDTVIVAVITSNLRHGDAPGNVRVPRGSAGLRSESVVNVSQIATIDKGVLARRSGRLPAALMAEVDAGVRLVLDV